MDDLFDYASAKAQNKNRPLAARMRPQSLHDFVGQEHILAKGRLLRRAIEADKLTSVVFYGPPGCGKTTLANVIAAQSASRFMKLSAVTSGIAEMRELIKEAREELRLYMKRTLLFIDEIHRFNKTQQDALLPAVEEGVVILIGATTENPYFEVNGALLSRSRIFKLEPLKSEHILLLLKRALDQDTVLAALDLSVEEEALAYWAELSAGDARFALNALELAALTTQADDKGSRHIDLAIAEESIQKRVIRYDKGGDWHYDVISAFIKSMRGSDPDAALHWLARMCEAGESPEFIARRIVICAAEDVGLADPMALVVAMAAAQSVHFVGWPEAQIPLAEAALYIACASKSNSTVAGISAARADLAGKELGAVPLYLRDASYKGAKNFGHGVGYLYPHDYTGNYIAQQYLPDELKETKYYNPTENGMEARIRERLLKRGQQQKDKIKPHS
ncbi:MAG: replication-associated recombination protein A [Firmicutes bacterium]|nr:replication-associated recombination protein A [Bacillota bacterium]